MPRNFTGRSLASAIAILVTTPATALDVDPSFEFEVLRASGSTSYYTDVNQAANELVAVTCEQYQFVSCALTGVSFFNSLYTAAYDYEDKNGAHYHSTVWGYRYYTCAVSPSLYLVSGDRESGPYANRTKTPPPPGGKYVCRTSGIPGDGNHHGAELGKGDCETRPIIGNPINVGAGNKYQEVIDISATANSPLTWSRFYNSGAVAIPDNAGEASVAKPGLANLGSHWRGTYDRTIEGLEGTDNVRLHRHTGEQIDYSKAGNGFRSAVDPRGRLELEADGWTFYADRGDIERYDSTGRLTDLNPGTKDHIRIRHDGAIVEVSDLAGRSLLISYDDAGRAATVRDGTGVAVAYTYSDATSKEADLLQATYADGTSQRYTYNEPSFVGNALPHALTGIFDETGRRFASFRYDTMGRTVSSEHANAIDRVSLANETDGSVTVTGPTNAVHRYRYVDIRGIRRLAGVDQPGGAGCGAAFSKLDYDDNGLLIRSTNFDGRVTEYTYDADGRELTRTDAAGTSMARVSRKEWHPTLMVPTRLTLPGREERLTYDDAGNLTRRELWAAIDPAQKDAPLTLSRTWTFTYDADGRLLEEKGPRSDSAGIAALQRYTYRGASASNCGTGGACDYRKGDLATVENALGHKYEFLRVDAAGRVLSTRLANGTLVDLEYTDRGWLLSQKESRTDGVIATTTFTYDERGDVTSVTDGDGVTLRFEYDAAGRLVQMSNPSNHKLILDLDKAGRPVRESTYDSFFLKTRLSRTYDALGRVATEQGDGAGMVSFTYDEIGRPSGVTDGDGRRSSTNYDALGRLMEAVDDLDGKNASIKAAYDPLDQMTKLEDPDGVTTQYLATGMGELAHMDSPDGGESYDERDATGLITRHDGPEGIGSFAVARDALGRPLKLAYSDPKLDSTYVYDTPDASCPGDKRSGVGLLSSMTNAQGRTTFCYDGAGNVVRKLQQWGTSRKSVSYGYTKAGRLASMGVEGGATARYNYDIDGKINGVTVDHNGTQEALITKVVYRPFDSIESWTYANEWVHSNSRDKAGRVTAWGGVDPNGSVYWLDPSPGGQIRADVTRPYAYAFTYDGLGYLNGVSDYNTSKSLRAFEYNASGDRLSVQTDGLTDKYDYQPGTHRLVTAEGKARRYDSAGNLVAIGDATLAYDAAGRLASASEQGKMLVSYGYDGVGNRVARTLTAGSATALSVFDEAERWVADYDEAGQVKQQAIWMGGLVVGLIDEGKLHYVSADHLGSPREVLDPQRNTLVWHWRHNADPFGSTIPDQDPDGDGKDFVFDMRFPGQRYDRITGLHANGARDYDPVSGRFIQVDPIGLFGGTNPYLYVGGAPLNYSDPTGNCPWCVGALISVGIDLVSQLIQHEGNWRCISPTQLLVSGALGAAGGAWGSMKLTKSLKALTNKQKGVIGERLSIASNRLRLSRLEGTQESIPGYKTIVDSRWTAWLGRGREYYVESKFGTSSLSKAQRVARDSLGPDRYHVERWSYNFVGQAGASAGGIGSGVVTSTAGAATDDGCGCD